MTDRYIPDREPNMHGVQIGERYLDNAPYRQGRVLVVLGTRHAAAVARPEKGGRWWAFYSYRFHRDGKPRKSGFSLIVEGAP